MKRIYFLTILWMTFLSNGLSQGSMNFGMVKGTMSDNYGEAFIGASVQIKGMRRGGTITDIDGSYQLQVPEGTNTLIYSYTGYQTQEVSVQIKAGETKVIDVVLNEGVVVDEVVVVGYGSKRKKLFQKNRSRKRDKNAPVVVRDSRSNQLTTQNETELPEEKNGEEYDSFEENKFVSSSQSPLSTFSIDVDNASYSNTRRFLNSGELPPPDAVRIEEFINYFDYDYPQPNDVDPFSISTEISDCPWNKEHKLAHIGMQGCHWEKNELPPSNLVFLIDVSGSMDDYNKLPLLKKAFKLLVDQLRDEDKVSIVVYAGSSGLALPPTSGRNKQKIFKAIRKLKPGGGTSGEGGIRLAYKTAETSFMEQGNNRIILATDGDFNIGISNSSQLVKLIEEKRKSGVYLSVLGFGMGNYKDGKMEQLADNGNGNYAYIDNLQEAKKVLVDQISGTLHTIAKDVKLQLEFNPKYVKEYRLIGYENRKLKDEDFNNDQKDAGELGAGHTVTALYEIIPITIKSDSENEKLNKKGFINEDKNLVDPNWMTIKLRYKEPNREGSKLLVFKAKDEAISLRKTSNNFKFSAAAASFGMLLRNSQFAGNSDYDSVIKLAKRARGKDEKGYRKEFIKLVKKAKRLDQKTSLKN